MHIELHSVVGRKDGVMWTPVDREAVILAENHYVTLDDIGRRIWDLLEQPQRVDQLCQRLGTEFNAEAGRIEADVLPFLAELQKEGLIRLLDRQAA